MGKYHVVSGVGKYEDLEVKAGSENCPPGESIRVKIMRCYRACAGCSFYLTCRVEVEVTEVEAAHCGRWL